MQVVRALRIFNRSDDFLLIHLTDTFCFINIAKIGLASIPEIRGDCDIDLEGAKRVIAENRDIIRGIKIRGIQSVVESVGLKAVEMAKKMGSELKLPVMIHIGESRDRIPNDFMDSFTREAIKLLDQGDIISHFLTRLPGGVILPDGSIAQELWDAKKRGVILDACHGLWHFSFEVAKQAFNQGLLPTVISTDLSAPNVTIVQSLLVTMSKFLNLGLTLEQVVEMTTLKVGNGYWRTKPGNPETRQYSRHLYPRIGTRRLPLFRRAGREPIAGEVAFGTTFGY